MDINHLLLNSFPPMIIVKYSEWQNVQQLHCLQPSQSKYPVLHQETLMHLQKVYFFIHFALENMKKTSQKVAYFSIIEENFCSGLAAPKQKSRTTKSLFMQDWVSRLGPAILFYMVPQLRARGLVRPCPQAYSEHARTNPIKFFREDLARQKTKCTANRYK